ncbi:WD40-repeat-containing domain protein [Dichotomocladium elegans]|nr:WD40-repeat-containing domain protein [Dichotomocladium elegans]
MQDPFFATAKKRKRTGTSGASKASTPSRSAAASKQTRKPTTKDSDVESGDESDRFDNLGSGSDSESSEEEIEETAAEKRVRLAKAYLDKIQAGLEEQYDGFDAADLDRDLISERLRKDEDEMEGRMHRFVADQVDVTAIDGDKVQSRRGHQLPVTAIALAENGSVFYTASKDCSIIKWDVKTLKKLHVFPGGRKGVEDFVGHTDHILCLAISSDNQYLASGGRDKIINIWSVKDNTHVVAFKQHKDTVSGLAFRKGKNQLYSASWDRTVKVWNVDERGYVETLFGHQDQIADIDTLIRERCVTVGSRDKTARMWKIVEESQLVYRGGIQSKQKIENGRPLYTEGSLDCIAQVEESIFITGGDSGVISLWDINRKKPIFSQTEAHGINTTHSESEGDINTPFWITAVASLRYSDLFVSGSWDGFVRFWKISKDKKNFVEIGKIAVAGVVNSLELKTVFPSNRTYLLVGVGQELKGGRWLRLKGVKNCTKILELPHLN